MDKFIKEITFKDFLNAFGAHKDEFSLELRKYINNNDFFYKEIIGKEKSLIINSIDKKLKKKLFSKSGEKRLKDWNNGWKENYIEFKKKKYRVSALIPKYIHGDRPVRWKQKFIHPKKKFLEWRFSTVFRTWLFSKYFKDVENIFDFGAGTACHLELISRIFPKKKLYGFDWSPYTKKIIDLLRNKKKLNIFGNRFDFFNINKKLKIPFNTGVLTYGALEQVGDRHKKFIDYLIKNKPQICVHVECMENMYDKKNKIDKLGYRYHVQRGYLKGFIPHLKKKEKEKKIKIIKIKRLYFGSYYQEVYNYVIWKTI